MVEVDNLYNAYYVPNVVPNTLHVLTHSILNNPIEVGTVIPILQLRNMRPRKIKLLAQGGAGFRARLSHSRIPILIQ